MKFKLAAVLITIVVSVAIASGAFALTPAPGTIAIEKLSEVLDRLNLPALQTARQQHDGVGAEGESTCDPTGEYNIHYWRTADEVGAIYLDGCIDAITSTRITAVLDSMDLNDIPVSLLVDGEGYTYSVKLFCTGPGKRARIDGDEAICE